MIITIRGEIGTVVKMESYEAVETILGGEAQATELNYTIGLHVEPDKYVYFNNVRDEEIKIKR